MTGTLYVVATPIGNLADASPRSIETLRAADLIACEDTRTSRTLLAHYGISARTVPLHEHNERTAGKALIQALRQGKNVALVSDAGTPTLSDPGAWLVGEAHAAGIPVSPLPGPSAAAAAISAAGFPASRFLFAGFLPAQAGARRKALEALDLPWPVAWLDERRERAQGEFVLVLAPGEARPAAAVDAERVLDVLLAALPPSEAAKLAARITGQPKGELYRKALARAK